MDHLLRLDLRINTQEDVALLDQVKTLFQRKQYSDAIRDCIRNYPRLLKEFEDSKLEIKKLRNKLAEQNQKVDDFITALDNLKKR